MGQIKITYEIPDGELCTRITHQEGHILNDVYHCQFRTSLHLVNGEKTVICNAFNKKLELNAGDIPYKCELCPKK
jgi:hypothetical protein